MNRDEAITLGAAIMMLALTAWFQIALHRRYKSWTSTTGIVIRVRPEDQGRNIATIRYMNRRGEMIDFSGTTLPDVFGVGSEVPLLYSPRSGKLMADLPGNRHIPVTTGYFFAGFLLLLFVCFRYGNRGG